MTITAEQFKDAARKAVVAGDVATARKLIARAKAAEAASPKKAAAAPVASSPQQSRIDDFAAFEMANPDLVGRYTPENFPQPGAEVIVSGGGRGGRGRRKVTVQPSTVSKGRVDYMSAPIGAGPNDMKVGETDTGEAVYLSPSGVRYTQTKTYEAPKRETARPLYEVIPLAGQKAYDFGVGVVDSFVQGISAPARALSGQPMTSADALATASLMAGGAPQATRAATVAKSAKAASTAYQASVAKPTVESLRAAKTAAYKAVDDAGETFSADAMTALSERVKADLAEGNYVPGVDRQTDAVVALLDRKAGAEIKLGQLDKIRQDLYRRLSAAPNEVGIRSAIEAIDEMIASNAGTSDLMRQARLANTRYKKVELLDDAFQKAKDQTDSTGSGGNIGNRFRSAVASIIDNPKKAKWFSADELATMRAFVKGSTAQNTMRLLGKLAPSGNGLMLALNLFGAGATGGASLYLTGAAVGAKAIADRAAVRGADRLITRMGTGAAEAARRPAPGDIIVGPAAKAETAKAAERPAAPVEASPAPPAAPQELAAGPAAPTAAPGTALPASASSRQGGLEVLSGDALQNVQVDARTFQFKSGGDEAGVTERLRGVRNWDPERTGIAIVWERKDGQRFIVDGHQRLGLAKRLADAGQPVELPVRVLREADGVTAAMARGRAAAKNIAEGTGSPLDAAKVLRDIGATGSDLNLPPNSALVRQGEGIARLSDDAFGMVANGAATEQHGALVGRLVPDPALHANILGLVTKLKPRNAVEAESIIEQAKAAGSTREVQTSLFGDEVVARSLYIERARVLDNALKRLAEDRSTFALLTKRGEKIAAAGNVLDPVANAKRVQESGELLQYVKRLANMKGPISDALTAAAERYQADRKVAVAAERFVEAVRSGIARGDLDGSLGRAGGDAAESARPPQAATDAEGVSQSLFDMQPGDSPAATSPPPYEALWEKYR